VNRRQEGNPGPIPIDVDGSWRLWWEQNKLEFLGPNRLQDLAGVSDALTSRAETSEIWRLRGELLARLLHSISDPEAELRGAAAIALGRVGRHEAVPFLIDLLDDPNQAVRRRAILGLGASGVPRAAECLLGIARSGRVAERGELVSPRARSVAIVALAIGRSRGFGPEVDAVVAELLAHRGKADRRLVGAAVMTYQRLAPIEFLWPVLRRIAVDHTEPVAVRCGAIEALATSGDASDVALLAELASGRDMQLRRSALLALGEARGGLGVRAVRKAYEDEGEPLARGFALLAIGRQGAAADAQFLARELTEGPKEVRPWAALALGLLARRSGDDGACAAIVAALQREARTDVRGAYLLGAGLTRHASAVAAASQALSSEDETTRMYAALALGLVGSPQAHAELRQRLDRESSNVTRAGILQALAHLGVRGDESILMDAARKTRTPELGALAAFALGFHGTPEATRGALAIAGGPSTGCTTPGVVLLNVSCRAAALDAAGQLLGHQRAWSLSAATRSSNFTVFEPWLIEVTSASL
jgi:HEAT repeat protein